MSTYGTYGAHLWTFMETLMNSYESNKKEQMYTSTQGERQIIETGESAKRKYLLEKKIVQGKAIKVTGEKRSSYQTTRRKKKLW